MKKAYHIRPYHLLFTISIISLISFHTTANVIDPANLVFSDDPANYLSDCAKLTRTFDSIKIELHDEDLVILNESLTALRNLTPVYEASPAPLIRTSIETADEAFQRLLKEYEELNPDNGTPRYRLGSESQTQAPHTRRTQKSSPVTTQQSPTALRQETTTTATAANLNTATPNIANIPTHRRVSADGKIEKALAKKFKPAQVMFVDSLLSEIAQVTPANSESLVLISTKYNGFAQNILHGIAIQKGRQALAWRDLSQGLLAFSEDKVRGFKYYGGDFIASNIVNNSAQFEIQASHKTQTVPASIKNAVNKLAKDRLSMISTLSHEAYRQLLETPLTLYVVTDSWPDEALAEQLSKTLELNDSVGNAIPSLNIHFIVLGQKPTHGPDRLAVSARIGNNPSAPDWLTVTTSSVNRRTMGFWF